MSNEVAGSGHATEQKLAVNIDLLAVAGINISKVGRETHGGMFYYDYGVET